MSFNTSGKPSFLEGRDLALDDAQHHPGITHAHEGVTAKSPDAGRRDGEVALLGGLEFLDLPVVHDSIGHGLGVLGGEPGLGYRGDLPVDLDRRGKIHGDEQVGALLVDQDLEQVPHKLDRLISFHTPSLRLS
jgi:hypothetical protein